MAAWRVVLATSLLAIVLASVLPITTVAQILRTRRDVVLVDVAVTRGHRPVAGLTADDFVLTDNGVAQPIDQVTTGGAPLSILLVLDTSDSVAGDKLARLTAAARAVLRATRPGDRVALITFSHVVRIQVGLTDQLARIDTALDCLAAGGATSLNDAIQIALGVRPAADSRPVMLLFTDGQDTASWLSAAQLLDTVRRGDRVIHAMHLADAIRVSEVRALDRLTLASGGQRWPADAASGLSASFVQALDDMRARYVLAFSPAGVLRPGWHELKVRLARTQGEVKARLGYYISEADAATPAR